MVDSGPKIFKMLERSANRPLIFIVFEFKVDDNVKLNPSSNVEVGLFETNDIKDEVGYSPEYSDYIKKNF